MFLFQEFQDRFQNLGHILEEVCKVDSQNNKNFQVYNKNREKCCRLFSDCKAKWIKEIMKASGGIKEPKKNIKNSSDDTDGSKDSDNDNSSGTGDDSNHSSDNGVNADSSDD